MAKSRKKRVLNDKTSFLSSLPSGLLFQADLNEDQLQYLVQLLPQFDSYKRFNKQLKSNDRIRNNEINISNVLLIARSLSDQDQRCVLEIFKWYKFDYQQWISSQTNKTLEELATHYNIGAQAYFTWLKKRYQRHRSVIIAAIMGSIQEDARKKLEQNHKTTATVVESISGAGFPIDLGWFLYSVTAIKAFLDIFAVALIASTGVLSLAFAFGAIVYWTVSTMIQKEEESAMVQYALLSRRKKTNEVLLELTKKEMIELCSEIAKSSSIYLTDPNEIEKSIREIISQLPQFNRNLKLKTKCEELNKPWQEKPFDGIVKPFNRAWFVVSPLLVGFTLFGGLYFGLYTSVISLFTMLGATAMVGVLTGGTAYLVIGAVFFCVAAYFAWGNYESMQSIKQRDKEVKFIQAQTANVENELSQRKFQKDLLKDMLLIIRGEKLQSAASHSGDMSFDASFTLNPRLRSAPVPAPAAASLAASASTGKEQRDSILGGREGTVNRNVLLAAPASNPDAIEQKTHRRSLSLDSVPTFVP